MPSVGCPNSARRRLIVDGRFLTQAVTGVQRYAIELLTAMDALLPSDRPPLVEVLHPPAATLPDVCWRNIGVRAVGRLAGQAWEQLEFPRYCRGADVFCPGNLAPLGLLHPPTRSLLGVGRVVVTVHDVSFRDYPSAYRRTFRWLYRGLTPAVTRWADAVLTDSAAEADRIARYYPACEGRLRVVPLGAASHELNELARAPGDAGSLPDGVEPPFVLYVGSWNHRKNLQGFLDSLPILFALAGRLPLSAVVVGTGGHTFGGRAFSTPAEVERRVRWLGRTSDVELARLYQEASCLVFPSFDEGAGLPPSEAMVFGCPVVTSGIPVLRERCGDAAVYCDPHAPADIARATHRVATDRALRNSLRERGFRRAARFTWHETAAATLEVLGVRGSAEQALGRASA